MGALEDHGMMLAKGRVLEFNVVRGVPKCIAVGQMGQSPQGFAYDQVGENDPRLSGEKIADDGDRFRVEGVAVD